METKPKLSRHFKALEYLWAMLIGVVVALLSNLLPQAAATRDLLVGLITCMLAIVVLTFWPAISTWVGYFDSPVTFRLPRWHPPVWAGKRMLRRETLDLVKDIRTYQQGNPSFVGKAHSEWRGAIHERQTARYEGERNESREREATRTLERFEGDRVELAALFGGRLQYVVVEYVRREMLSGIEISHLEWEAESRYRMVDVANKLEALAIML
jgi:hypothetical protein